MTLLLERGLPLPLRPRAGARGVGRGACCRRTSRIGICHQGAVGSGEQLASELDRILKSKTSSTRTSE
jgi:hypothetical protein